MDVVFARQASPASRTTLLALLIALALHGALWLWANSSEASLESWSAELAARVHQQIGKEQVVELAPPPPEKPPPPPEAPPPPERVRQEPRPVRAKVPPPPAQAGRIVAAEPHPDAPVDLTGNTFVTGSADAYAGGITTATGTNKVAVPPAVVDPNARPTRRPGEPDRSAPVRLSEEEWQCPWPREADAEQIDEQAVILRVLVRADGSAETASLVSDPGHGFGQAALACALRTRFTPARNSAGEPIQAQSPPIRVRFTR